MTLFWALLALLSCMGGNQGVRESPLPQNPNRLTDQAKLKSMGQSFNGGPLTIIEEMDADPDPLLRHKAMAYLEATAGENELRHMLAAEAPKDKRRISLRIGALQLMNKLDTLSANAIADIWTTVVKSRLGIFEEDPDLFERGLRIISKMPDNRIRKITPLMGESVSTSLMTYFKNRHQRTMIDFSNAQSARIKEKTKDEITRFIGASLGETPPSDWVSGLTSEKGGMSRSFWDQVKIIFVKEMQIVNPEVGEKIMEAEGLNGLKSLEFISPPKLKPGQYQDISPPKESNPVIKAPIRAPKPMLATLFLICGIFAMGIGGGIAFRFKSGWPLILAGPGLLLVADGTLGLSGAALPAIGNLATLNNQSVEMLDRDYQPFEKVTTKNGDWLISNGGPSRFVEMSAQKDPSAIRILVFGASSVHGSNHLKEEAFPAILETTLQEQAPSRAFEIINMGIGGVNSGGIIKAAQPAMSSGVDGIIFMYGHNESAQFNQLLNIEDLNPTDLEGRIWWFQSRLVQFLSKQMKPKKKMQSTVEATKPSLDRAQVLQKLAAANLKSNLGLLLDMAQSQSIKPLILNVTPNFRFAPMSPFSKDSPDSAKKALADSNAPELSKKQALKMVNKALQSAKKGSATHLEALRQSSELLAALGDKRGARVRYQAALDHSKEVTVVNSQIRNALKEMAAERSASYLDLQELFYKGSPDGLSANELFWDELHPSTEGHRRIAKTITPWAMRQFSLSR